MTRRLIVNADDYGLTRGVSEGILAAHRHGIVTSTTVLVTGDIAPDLVARARDSGLGLGVHVNLTLGAPLTRGRSLVDAGGRFVRDARRAAAVADEDDVLDEVEAQLARFEKLFKRAPTHLDSHHHVGLYAPVRDVVLDVARARGLAVRSQDGSARMRARSAGLRTPDHFFGESGPGAYWSPARTLAHLRALPAGVSEFMTHPGWFDADLAYSRYGRQRETEMIGLGLPAARAAAAAAAITLCHFGHL
ncbi:MAG TPA: ChbG/HpnK family deacetylase [Candidatus Limnocylindria bacterium]|nr:ChbG/HpnK family deacetylase [Candidatus Limnocylindria bacterium]